MRNLKKFLALALAMVMTFSLMLSAGAVDYDDYPDKDSITAEFEEAVQVLTGLEVFQGDDKGGFRPSDKITRAEAAAVIYRAATGDVTDRQTDLYKDYSTFTDVNSGDWFAGYVGYCQNAGYIKGTTPTTFNPYGQVTGYEVLAMILRVVGYGKNNEFTGNSWQVNVASLSKQLGVTRDVVAAHMDQTLNMAAPREVVADLVFMTMATVPMVTFTPALAYNDKQNLIGINSDVFNPTLGQQTFGLFYSTTWQIIDDWGRPGYYWWQGGEWLNNAAAGTAVTAGALTTVNTGKAYVNPIGHPVYGKRVGGSNYTAVAYVNSISGLQFTDTTNAAEAWREANLVATISVDPSYSTNEQVRECDVAHELNIAVEDTFNLFVNGLNGNDAAGGRATPAINSNYRIVATDTVTKVGGQGRVTEFYYEMSNPWFQQDQTTNVAVMIDTMLTQVTSKTDAKLDKNNHVIVPAQLEVTIWDGASVGANPVDATSSKRIISKASDDATNWDDYSKGDYILINAWTNKINRNSDAERDSAAFETDKVVNRDWNNTANILTIDERAWIVDNGKKGIAENFNGKQTVIYYNQNKHQVDSKDYNDQICLFMDCAGSNLNTTYTWYLDQFGNLIGIGDAAASRFGVITNVYAAISQGESDTTGRVKAVASVRYTNGETGTVTVDSFLMSSAAAVAASSAPANAIANAAAGTQLTDSANTIELLPVYDEATHPAMSVGPITTSLVGNSSDAQWTAWLYMAPSAATNLNNHFGNGVANQFDVYGILYDHMFEFTTASDDSVVAVEVAGQWLTNDSTNTGIYDDKANGKAHTDGNNPATDADMLARGRVYKSLGYMALNADPGVANTSAAPATAYLDNNTQILVRNNRTLTAYTLESLPGNVTLGSATEADWADVDGDGRIDYLYVTGTVPGTVTYNLFYYNGGPAEWSSSGGTIEGYLDGESATITFGASGRSMFDAISNSVSGYDGHLFAIRINNDQVNSVMFADGLNTAAFAQGTREILKAWDATSASFLNVSGWVLGSFNTNIRATNSAAGDPFLVGSAGGNTYTANTEAVYWRDSVTTDGTADNAGITRHTNASYVRVSNGYQIQVIGTQASGTAVNETYWISPSAKIQGELEWLNQYECDVTIVYENTDSNAAVQVYITPDPDVTPVGPDQLAPVGTRPIGTAVVGGGSTAADMQNSIINGAANTVIWGDPAATGLGTTSIFAIGKLDVANDAANPIANNIFFPFSVANGSTANLRITEAATGTLVYTEGTGALSTGGLDVSAGNNHAFAVNFHGDVNNAGAPRLVTLRSGVTYNFIITTPASTGGDVTVSQGSFTMN